MNSRSDIDFRTGMNNFADMLDFISYFFGKFNNGYAELNFSSHKSRHAKPEREYLSLPLDETPESFREKMLPYAEDQITFGAAPRFVIPPAAKKRGADEAVAEIGCIWSEIQYSKVQGGIITAIERISGLPLRPSVVVNSGVARQVYYLLKEPLRGSKLLDWKNLTRGLNDILGISADFNPGDRFPLPGSFTIHSGSRLACHVCTEESSLIEYSAEEMTNFLEEASALSSGAESKQFAFTDKGRRENVFITSDFAPTESDLRARKVPSDVIKAIFSIRTDRDKDFDENPSKKPFEREIKIIQSLLKKNFAAGEITALFLNNPKGCGRTLRNARNGEQLLDDLLKKAAVKAEEEERAKGNDPVGTDQLPPGYHLDRNGAVWLEIPASSAGREPKSVAISSSPLRITAIREDIDTGQISVVISYEYLGRTRSNTILRSQMCNARSLVATLSGEGAPINSNNARLLVDYLAAYEHEFADLIPRKKVTSKFGRNPHSRKFFLPGLASETEFSATGQGDVAAYRAFSARKGSLAEWVRIINSLPEKGFMIPQIAVTASFVPPLQKYLEIPNFILDIFGNTSSGKSTTLKLASSVFGSPFDPDSLIHQWMNTKIAIEQIAGMCSELPIYLDDAQHCTSDLKRTVIYMIANGKGKGRASGHGRLRETMTWRTVALSTSEEPLHESSAHEGVRSRLLPLGGFVAPFPPNSGSEVQSLEKAIGVNHGYAGETYIRHLNGWTANTWAKWEHRYHLLRSELAMNSGSDIIGRVGGYIAAIGVAGEIICPLLGLNFKPDVMTAWLVGHVQEQQGNQNQVLRALRVLADHYLSNLNSFAGTETFSASRKGMQGISKNGVYVGFMRNTLDGIFGKYRWNQTAVLQKMSEAGVLISTEADRFTKKVTHFGVKHRLVCVKWSSILPDE